MKREEDKIQIAFVKWVNLQYPKLAPFLFHIPNGGKMSVITGSRLKAMGVKKGVADILFMFKTDDFGGLWLEFKTKTGRQSKPQQDFERLTEIAFYDYHVVRSVDEAMLVFNNYLEFINARPK